MSAVKAQWVVSAELIPGTIIEELTRVWQYTSSDFQADGEDAAIFKRYREEANAYALELQNPAQNNIVRLVFMWL